MSDVSPDGKWLWDGRQWLPNVPQSLEHDHEPQFQAAAAGPSSYQASYNAGPHQTPGSPYGPGAQGGWPAAAPRAPLTPAQELNLAGWAHYGPLVACGVALLLSLTFVLAPVGFLAALCMPAIPLVIREVQGKQSRYVKAHATESLNFQLTWLLASVVLAILTVITFGIALLLGIPAFIFMIVVMIKAGAAAKTGTFYRYPLTFRFVPDA